MRNNLATASSASPAPALAQRKRRATEIRKAATTLRARIGAIYAREAARPPFGRVAQGLFVAVLLIIAGIDIAAQLEGRPPGAGPATAAIVFWEATSVVSSIALLPLVWPCLRYLHRRADRKALRWGALAMLGMVAATLHIAGFKLLRVAGAAWLGPPFACPLIGKLPFEFAKDLTFFGGLVGGLFLAPERLRQAIFDLSTAPRRPAPALVQLTSDLLDLPDGRHRLRYAAARSWRWGRRATMRSSAFAMAAGRCCGAPWLALKANFPRMAWSASTALGSSIRNMCAASRPSRPAIFSLPSRMARGSPRRGATAKPWLG